MYVLLSEECPLQSVECEFKWAGCQYTPLHKDLQQHNDNQLKHMSLLAEECRDKTEKLNHICEQLRNENQELRDEYQEFKKYCTYYIYSSS